MLKRLLRSPRFQTWLGGRLAAYMRLVARTTRWEYINRDGIEATWASKRPIVMAYWHGRIMQAHVGWPTEKAQPPLMLISQSHEGEIIAQACEGVGVATIRGSSMKKGRDKGGARAFLGIVKHMRAGGAGVITPDGPKGPRMRVSPGAIKLAQSGDGAIVAMTWSIKAGFTMNSWDRFLIPLPWSRGVMAWGDPIPVPKESSEEALDAVRAALEVDLNRLTWLCDERCGRKRIEPDAAREETEEKQLPIAPAPAQDPEPGEAAA
jgi:lysophospholipid acyltransferase (LPLAT)-like uncharacterized protein